MNYIITGFLSKINLFLFVLTVTSMEYHDRESMTFEEVKYQHYVTAGRHVMIIYYQQMHIQAMTFSFDYLNKLS